MKTRITSLIFLMVLINATQYNKIENHTYLTNKLYKYVLTQHDDILGRDLIYIHAKLHHSAEFDASRCIKMVDDTIDTEHHILRYKKIDNQILFLYIELNFIASKKVLDFMFSNNKTICNYKFDYAVMKF